MSDSPIEAFLDELVDRLQLQPRTMRRVLREVEGHLHEAAQEIEAAGVRVLEAETQAVDSFGTPAKIASDLNETHNGFWNLSSLGMSLASLAAIGFIIIGVSGLLIWVLGGSFGYRYVVVPVHQQDYTAARCADLLSSYRNAPDCTTAAMLDHYDELRDYRIAVGILGLIGLAGLWFLRRFVGPLRWLPHISRPSTWAIAAGMFGLATVVAGILALTDGALSGTDGAGQLVATATASLLGFAIGAFGYMRTSRRPHCVITPR